MADFLGTSGLSAYTDNSAYSGAVNNLNPNAGYSGLGMYGSNIAGVAGQSAGNWLTQNATGLGDNYMTGQLDSQLGSGNNLINNGMTGSDWAGVGIGALNAGLGFLSNKAQIDVAEGNLDLSKDKFAYLKQQDADTRAATEANSAASKARITG